MDIDTINKNAYKRGRSEEIEKFEDKRWFGVSNAECVGEQHVVINVGDKLGFKPNCLYIKNDRNLNLNGHALYIEGDIVIQMYWENNMINGDLFQANKRTKKFDVFHVCNNIVVEKLQKIPFQGTVDNDVDGSRWTGQILDIQDRSAIPCGWCDYYDSEGHRTYSGFSYNFKRVCYGISYFLDIHSTEYEGYFCNSEWWGYGISFDRNRREIYRGDWITGSIAGKRISTFSQTQNDVVDSFTTIINMKDSSNYFHSIYLSYLSHLEEFKVGNYCMRLSIPNLMLEISNLPLLKTISIGHYSFHNYSINLHNLPNLRSIDIKSHCFETCPQFILDNIQLLKQISIGDSSFVESRVLSISNMNGLERISIGRESFTSKEFQFYLCNLFNLSSLTIGENSCSYESIRMSNVPNLMNTP